MNKYCQTKLKRKLFEALKENYLTAMKERQDKIKAEKFSLIWIKRHYYSIWADRFEEKTDMKSIHLMYKARVHYQNVIVRKYYQQWFQFKENARTINVSISAQK